MLVVTWYLKTGQTSKEQSIPVVTLFSSVDNVTDTVLVARITHTLMKHPALKNNGRIELFWATSYKMFIGCNGVYTANDIEYLVQNLNCLAFSIAHNMAYEVKTPWEEDGCIRSSQLRIYLPHMSCSIN